MAEPRTTTKFAMQPRIVVRPRVPALVGLVAGAPPIYVMTQPEIRVGRSERCDLRLSERGVSREHAILVVAEGPQVSIVDLRARNGTFVNGRRIDAATLAESDEIHFGPLACVRFTCSLITELANATRKPTALDLEPLSPRERQVAELVSQGLTNAAIASKLSVRPRTVGTHLEHIFAKLAISSRTELVRRIVERQLAR